MVPPPSRLRLLATLASSLVVHTVVGHSRRYIVDAGNLVLQRQIIVVVVVVPMEHEQGSNNAQYSTSESDPSWVFRSPTVIATRKAREDRRHAARKAPRNPTRHHFLYNPYFWKGHRRGAQLIDPDEVDLSDCVAIGEKKADGGQVEAKEDGGHVAAKEDGGQAKSMVDALDFFSPCLAAHCLVC